MESRSRPEPLRTVVLLNPGAGALRQDPEIRTRLERDPRLGGAEIRTPEDAGGHGAAARRAGEEGWDLVVAGGGDGTVQAVAGGLREWMRDKDRSPEEGPVLGILPLGTANDFARSIGLGGELEQALDALGGAPEARPLDLLEIEIDGEDTGVCVNVAVGGFGGRVEERLTEEIKKTWGPLAYVRSGIEVLPERSPYHTTLCLDGGEAREIDLLNLVLANGRYAGGGIPVAPRARLDDGLVDVLVLPDLELPRLAGLAARILAGRHVEDVRGRRARTVEVESDPPLLFSLDGELRRASRLALRVVAGALRVVVGRNPEAMA